jgi:hypothetical protein
MTQTFTSPQFVLDVRAPERFARADIEFVNVEQAGPPFEAHVFLDRPDANASTGHTPENGYAGSFYVYALSLTGRQLSGGESDRARPLVPTTRYIVATEAVRAALEHGNRVVLTVVAEPHGPADDLGDILAAMDVRIVFDRLPEPTA